MTVPNQGTGRSCPIATTSTTNLTWIYLGMKPVLRDDRAATDRPKHDKAPENIRA